MWLYTDHSRGLLHIIRTSYIHTYIFPLSLSLSFSHHSCIRLVVAHPITQRQAVRLTSRGRLVAPTDRPTVSDKSHARTKSKGDIDAHLVFVHRSTMYSRPLSYRPELVIRKWSPIQRQRFEFTRLERPTVKPYEFLSHHRVLTIRSKIAIISGWLPLSSWSRWFSCELFGITVIVNSAVTQACTGVTFEGSPFAFKFAHKCARRIIKIN